MAKISLSTVGQMLQSMTIAFNDELEDRETSYIQARQQIASFSKTVTQLNEEVVELQQQLKDAKEAVESRDLQLLSNHNEINILKQTEESLHKEVAVRSDRLTQQSAEIVALKEIVQELQSKLVELPIDTRAKMEARVIDANDVARWLKACKGRVALACSNHQGVGVLRGAMEIDEVIYGMQDETLLIKFKV